MFPPKGDAVSDSEDLQRHTNSRKYKTSKHNFPVGDFVNAFNAIVGSVSFGRFPGSKKIASRGFEI